MAQEVQGQSHGDSPSNPLVSAPTSTSPSLAPIAASAAPPAYAASSAPVAAADTTLPSLAAAIAGTSSSTPSDNPTASTASAALPSAPVPAADPDVTAASSAPTSTPASAAAVSAAPSAVPQQNGDSRASEGASTPSSNPEMSNQHPGAPHGQPVSYPGPSTPYATTVGATTAQYASYPAVTSQQQMDAYRPNPMPVGSNVMSLPSMRNADEHAHGACVGRFAILWPPWNADGCGLRDPLRPNVSIRSPARSETVGT
ncbi:hypothetical protein Neosp_006700 [[Neocosmospora] mangrovei]